jgi:chromosome segregation ATPase
LGTGDLTSFLTALLARLPVGDLSVQRAIFDQIVTGVVRSALPSAQVCSLVQASRVALLRSCIDADLIGSDDLEVALQRAETQVVAPAPVAFEALANDIQMCRNAARATSQALAACREERAAIDAERHAQAARAERAEGARASVAQQLEQVQTWLREAQAEVKQVQAARQDSEQQLAVASQAGQRASGDLQRLHAERQQIEQNLQQALRQQQQLDQQLQAANAQREQVEQQLQAAHAQCEQQEQQVQQLSAQRDEATALGRQADERLAAQLASHRELEREFLERDHSLRSMHEHTAELARIVGLANDGDREGLERRLAFLLQEAEKFAATLRSAGAADERALLTNLDSLAKQLANTERTLREREQWVVALLQEVTARRLFPRDLLDHERAFLDRFGKPS